MFTLIAAIGKQGELGKDGQLLFHIKEDMNFFKKTTLGHKILMGRKTWESLPGKLQGRENIVVSRHPVKGADLTISDLPQFIHENSLTKEEIFVIGGGMLYSALLPYAKHLYLTEINATVSNADTFFPIFDPTDYTKEIIQSGKNYTIVKYTKKEENARSGI